MGFDDSTINKKPTKASSDIIEALQAGTQMNSTYSPEPDVKATLVTDEAAYEAAQEAEQARIYYFEQE